LLDFYRNLNVSGQIFGKSSNTKFHENPSCGSGIIPCGQTGGLTDWQTGEANSSFLAILWTRLKTCEIFGSFGKLRWPVGALVLKYFIIIFTKARFMIHVYAK